MRTCSRLVLVLDNSGSMGSQKNDIIGGVNETIKQQRLAYPLENDKVNFNIVTFNTDVSTPTNNTLANVPMLNNSSYITSGSTALYDAMGFTMQRYKDEHGVIMIVATDGEENASKHFNYQQVQNMIKQLREKQNWNFIYLSENINTFKQGDQLGLSSKVMNCNNILTKSQRLGSALGDLQCQNAIKQMRSGVKNVKIQTEFF